MLHHLSGQIKRPFPSDLRIFSKNIGNQAVLIVFNDASRDGKIPKRLAHRAAEHNPGRIEDTTKLIQKKYLGNLGLSVFPAFHEKPFFSDFQNIADKYLTQDRQNGSCRKK